MNCTLSHDEAKRRGERIAARLTALGHAIPLNHGLQAVAAAENFPDWNRMKAAIGRPQRLDTLAPAAGGVTALDAQDASDNTQDEALHYDDFDPAKELDVDLPVVYRITHHYDIGNQDVYVTRRKNEGSAGDEVDARRAALYCWCVAEAAFGRILVSNLGIAAALCRFYGFTHHWATYGAQVVDLYGDLEGLGPAYAPLMADPALAREGLAQWLEPFVSPA
ncbi:hypothetical protein [Cupriavidus pampae]|uniref:Uncharacterized protein n=1 Tax=Cupriavidus pampae TaxID=659251 RepID=A0ABM8XTQ6_9BURK|nr:hypothetical protein [Cupriavidus pampae]CAG9183749.1 hypothetical protein LMG32289_05408 [Cupriavidus pampae]